MGNVVISPAAWIRAQPGRQTILVHFNCKYVSTLRGLFWASLLLQNCLRKWCFLTFDTIPKLKIYLKSVSPRLAKILPQDCTWSVICFKADASASLVKTSHHRQRISAALL